MAIKLSDQYPGRAEPPSIDYPLGAFKNRSAPQVLDGTPLDKVWANDKEGFFQGVLAEAEITADGQPDKVGASQYLDALKSVIRKEAPTPDEATESTSGIAKISTLSQVQAGTDDLDFVTSKKIKDAGLWPIGVGQSWQDVTSSRLNNTVYTNSTGRPIFVIVSEATPGNTPFIVTVNNVIVSRVVSSGETSVSASSSFIVPNGGTYKAEGYTAGIWTELR